MSREMKSLRDERGSAFVIVVAAMVALLGFVALTVDVGMLFLNRERLNNATDAAVLAGVQILASDPAQTFEAEDIALDFAVYNGLDPGEVSVTVYSSEKRLRVTAERQVRFFFAPVLGLNSRQVSAHSEAQVGGVEAVYGVVPIGVVDQTLTYGTLYTLKYGQGMADHGNFGALAVGENKGASDYEESLGEGYHGWVRIGDTILTEPGNKAGPTRDGVADRISGHESCTSTNHEPDCPRLVTCPIYDYVGDNHGRCEVQVLGFAAFFLDGATGDENNCTITGYFIKKLTCQDVQGISGADYGLQTAKIIE
ncbi:MAG: TadE/TadG family type IV pilus assembly protein [Bacillota bacterium]